MKIAVVGTGYVGLVLGACLAENGNTVACVDKDADKVATLRAGKMPIYEPGLEEMVRRNHGEERLSFTTDLPAAVRSADIVFIAVGTPQGEDGSADLTHVLDVARAIGRAIDKYTVVVDKSTVPVGTAKQVQRAIAGETTQPFSVVSNPEFLKQGAAIEDFMKPDRVVIGVEPGDERAGAVMKELYGPFTRTGAPIMMMDTASAELSKYAANSILATRISFMNEIANMCELVGADVDHVRKAIGADRRIGIVVPVSRRRLRRQLLPEGRQGPDQVGAGPRLRLQDPARGRSREPRAEGAPGREDARVFREPEGQDDRGVGAGLQAAHRRHARGAGHRDHRGAAGRGRHRPRPTIRRPPRRRAASSAIASRSATRATTRSTGADALAVVTEWNTFREPDFEKMRERMRSPVVFDGRNIYSPEHMRALGFTYFSIGR